MRYLNLISGPRNISTALMYSFAQRSDTFVLDEPYYAFYLLTSGVDHPGKKEVVNSQPNTEEGVNDWINQSNSKLVLFIKNMAHHIEILEQKEAMSNMTNIFLIRNPKQIITSYSQVIEKPVMRDIGLEYQWRIFEQLCEKKEKPIVLDSGLLLENPEVVLRKLCDAIEITFEKSMLTWQAGPKPYDGVWANYWYANVHRSTCFEKQPASNRALRADLIELYEQARHYYEKLLPFAIAP